MPLADPDATVFPSGENTRVEIWLPIFRIFARDSSVVAVDCFVETVTQSADSVDPSTDSVDCSIDIMQFPADPID